MQKVPQLDVATSNNMKSDAVERAIADEQEKLEKQLRRERFVELFNVPEGVEPPSDEIIKRTLEQRDKKGLRNKIIINDTASVSSSSTAPPPPRKENLHRFIYHVDRQVRIAQTAIMVNTIIT
eukprot:UN01433